MLILFMPNEREAQKAARVDDLETAVQKFAVIEPLVAVKLGSEGAMAQRGTERVVSPSRKVEFVDAVGARNSFDAGFLHEYLHGGDLPACLATGNLAWSSLHHALGRNRGFSRRCLPPEILRRT